MALTEIAKKLPPVFAGAIAPYPPEFQTLINHPPNYQKYGKKPFYNPLPDLMLEEICQVLKQKTISKPPNPPEKKSYVFNFFAAFADQHTSPLPFLEPYAPKCKELLEKILDTSLKLQRPLTIPEQLKITLESFPDNNLTEIIILLAITSRAAARNYDSRLGIEVTKSEMEEWKTAVAPFAYSPNTLSDPAGDTYHFWEIVLAGISVRAKRVNGATLYEETTGKILEYLYRHTTILTNLIRYKMFRHKGTTHDTIDILGFEIGLGIKALPTTLLIF